MNKRWLQARSFDETVTVTGYSSASNHDIRNKKGELVGEFQAITWGGSNKLGIVVGSIVLMEIKENFKNEDLTICIDWTPHPLRAEPGERSRGYTIKGAMLFHPEATGRALEDSEIVVSKALTFKAKDVIPYENKLS